MASGVVNLAGKVIDQAGADKVGLTVQLYEAAIWEANGAATASTTTDADGKWAFSDKDITKAWLVCVIDGTKKYLIDARNKLQLTELDLITSLSVDTIAEHTANAGVTIDGLLIKDGSIGSQGTAGSYVGNATANRAIPHGLGVTPKIILLCKAADLRGFGIFGAQGHIIQFSAASHNVTIPNATNFYVGNVDSYLTSANESDITYYWVAIG